MKIDIAISTCPNDTFAFHALLAGLVDTEGLDFEFELLDIEALNAGLAVGRFDVAKASFHFALAHADQLWALPVGSALGYGVGPVLLSPPTTTGATEPGRSAKDRILTPGRWTTAHLLLRLLRPELTEPPRVVEHVVFSEIMAALARGDAEFGVCIHEGRFTYAQHGLRLQEDLGATWERDSGCPLPLGGLFARRELDPSVARAVARSIRRSIEYANENRSACEATMRRYAQELAADVLWAHVDLYVNEWTLDLGESGRRSVEILAQRGAESGAFARREFVVLDA